MATDLVQDVTTLFVGLKPRRSRFHPATMAHERPDGGLRRVGKPGGGLWTCREQQHYPGASSWLEFASHQGLVRPGHRSAVWRLRSADVRLFPLDTAEDIKAALRTYTRDYLSEMRPQFPPGPWDAVRFLELDHAAIQADGYDGLELTRRGLSVISPSSLDAIWEAPDLFHTQLGLWGWDVPTILWYRWAFRGAPERVSQGGSL